MTLGRFSFGSEFGYRHQAAGGSIVEPHVAIKGLWDFDDAGNLSNTLADTVASADDLRGKVEGGILFTRPDGVSMRATGSYDGIGADDFEAYSGKLWLNFPLN